MKKIGVLAAFAAAAAAALSVSAEVITFNTQKDWKKNPRVKFTADGIMEIRGRLDLRSKNFAVDPAKKYVFTAEIRCKPGTESDRIYVGNWSVTDKGKLITPISILPVRNSECTLLEDAAKGSTKIVISKPACWNAKSPARVWGMAMDVKADYSDLPHLIVYPIVKAEVEGDKITLVLRKGLTEAYKSGTALRIHRGGAGMYGGFYGKTSPVEWQTLTWTVSGNAQVGTNPHLRWWGNAQKGSLRIIANNTNKKGAVLQVRNVKLEVSDK